MENKSEFLPEIELEPEEIASLVSTMATPGFDVLRKILRSSVDRFAMNLINTDNVEEEKVLERHRMARMATIFLGEIYNRLNEYKLHYIYSQPNPKPIDSGAGLDLGEFATDENGEETLFS